MGIRRYLQNAFFADQASTLLLRIVAARAAVHTGRHGEALHDYRVLVRRLVESSRSWAPKTLRRAITRIARPWIQATNATRDLEVELEMIQELLKGKGQAGRGFLTKSQQALRGVLAAALKETEAFLSDPARAAEEQALARLFAEATRFPARPLDFPSRLQTKAEDLFARLKGPQGDQAELHQVRLAAKHVRYGLEPLAQLDRKIKPVLSELTALQRALGDQRDWHRLAAKLAQEGAPPRVARLAEERGEKILAQAPLALPLTEKLLRERWALPPLNIKALRARLLKAVAGEAAEAPIHGALDLAAKALRGRKRADKSGRLGHALRVAISLVEEAGLREGRMLAAALAHDAHLDPEELAAALGPEVAGAVRILTAAGCEEDEERKGGAAKTKKAEGAKEARGAEDAGNGGAAKSGGKAREASGGEGAEGEPGGIAHLRKAPAWIRTVSLADRLEGERYLLEGRRRKKARRFARQTEQLFRPAYESLKTPGARRLLAELEKIPLRQRVR